MKVEEYIFYDDKTNNNKNYSMEIEYVYNKNLA